MKEPEKNILMMLAETCERSASLAKECSKMIYSDFYNDPIKIDIRLRQLFSRLSTSEALTHSAMRVVIDDAGIKLNDPLVEEFNDLITYDEFAVKRVDIDGQDYPFFVFRTPFCGYKKERYVEGLNVPITSYFQFGIGDCVKRMQDNEIEIEQFENSFVLFEHRYNVNHKRKKIYDMDNVETKKMIDMLGWFFIGSDSMGRIETYYTSRQTEDKKHSMVIVTDVSQAIFAQIHKNALFDH